MQILAARRNMPVPELFGPLMEKLTQTVRDDIAECAAASFGTLSLPAAQKILMFESAADLKSFASSKVGEFIYVCKSLPLTPCKLVFSSLVEGNMGHL